jgi:peptide/nickel transport system substrate-binding protein
MKLYQQLDKMVIEDAPVVPLWYDQVLRLTKPGIKNFEANGLNLLELRRTQIEHQ